MRKNATVYKYDDKAKTESDSTELVPILPHMPFHPIKVLHQSFLYKLVCAQVSYYTNQFLRKFVFYTDIFCAQTSFPTIQFFTPTNFVSFLQKPALTKLVLHQRVFTSTTLYTH